MQHEYDLTQDIYLPIHSECQLLKFEVIHPIGEVLLKHKYWICSVKSVSMWPLYRTDRWNFQRSKPGETRPCQTAWRKHGSITPRLGGAFLGHGIVGSHGPHPINRGNDEQRLWTATLHNTIHVGWDCR